MDYYQPRSRQNQSRRQDSDVVQGGQGLLLFSPNLQSFGALPFGAKEEDDSQFYVIPGVQGPKIAVNENLSTIQSQQMGLQHFTRNMKSEEDVDDQEDEGSYALGADDSLERAVNDRSIRSLADQNSITKVSSTRKLNDQGGEGFLHPSESLKDMDTNSLRKQSRNMTFAAGSQPYLLSIGKSSAKSSRMAGATSSYPVFKQNASLSSETFPVLHNGQVPYQMSHTEADHFLKSSLLLSANQLSQIRTLCKDICSLMLNNSSVQNYMPELARQSMEGLYQVLIWRLDNSITPVEFSQIYTEWLRSNGHDQAPQLGNLLQDLATEMQIDQSAFQGSQSEVKRTQGKERLQAARLEESSLNLLQIGMKYSGGSLNHFLDGIPRMIELLKSEFNAQLVKEKLVDDLWIQIVERLYAQLDYEQGHFSGCGSLSADRMQFFLLTLLLNEIRSDNWMRIPEIVQKQSWSLLTNMRHMSGFVTLHDFKTYLLLEGVRSQADIQVLYEHFEIVLKTYKRIKRKNNESTANSSMHGSMTTGDQSKSSIGRQVYQNFKQRIEAEELYTSSKMMLGKSQILPQTLAVCALQALSYHSKETISQAMAQSREKSHANPAFGQRRQDLTLFDFSSQSIDEELESKIMLWRYVQQQVFSLGNEHGFMYGTFLSEANLDQMQSLLLMDNRARDSMQDSDEHTPLINYFEAVLLSYSNKNTEVLMEMCKYLQSHISTSQTSQASSLIDPLINNMRQLSLQSLSESRLASTMNHNKPGECLDDSKGAREDDSEVFSVHQFSSNAQQSLDKRDNNLQDSRPSFGNTYVTNFIREEELALSQKKSEQKPPGQPADDDKEDNQVATLKQQELQGVSIFGEIQTGNMSSNTPVEMTPNESTIKQDNYQEDSSLSFQRMGLHESGNDNLTTYQSMPNQIKSAQQDTSKNEIVSSQIKMPMTTKHGLQHETSSGMLSTQQIEDIEEPKQFEMEERLPRFQINLPQLQMRNLQPREYAQDLAVEEATGVGLMIAQREADVERIPKQKRQKHSRSPLVQLKGLTSGSVALQQVEMRKKSRSNTGQVFQGTYSQLPSAQQKLQSEAQMSKKHIQNVRSVTDVLSNLSTHQKSPKPQKVAQQQRAIRFLQGDESHPLLSIDSPSKFVQGGQSSSKELQSLGSGSNLEGPSKEPYNGRIEKASKKRARSALQLQQRYQSATADQNENPEVSSLISRQQQNNQTDTPSFSFRDQQSQHLFFNLNNTSSNVNKTQISMREDGAQISQLKNIQSMQPLLFSSQQNILTSRRHGDARIKGQALKAEQSHLFSNLSQQRVTSARSNHSAMLPQATRQRGHQSLLDNRSAFLSSFFHQKVKRQASLSQTSKTSLRRIESYDEVLKRLKFSVIQALNTTKKQKNKQNPDLSTANDSNQTTTGQFKNFAKTDQNKQYAQGGISSERKSARGISKKGNRRIQFEKSPAKHIPNQNVAIVNVKGQVLKSNDLIGFFQSAGSDKKHQLQTIKGEQSGFQTNSKQVTPKQMKQTLGSAISLMKPFKKSGALSRHAARITTYNMGSVESPLDALLKSQNTQQRQPNRSRSGNPARKKSNGRRQINNLELGGHH